MSRASRGRVIRQSRVRVRLRLPLGLFPRPNLAIDRSRPSIDPPPRSRDRSVKGRRVAVLSPIAASRARPRGRSIARAPIARVARARRSRVARAAPRPSRPRSRSRSRRLQDKTKRRPAHLARGGLLPRDALRPGRVRGVHDDARGANGKHVSRWRRRACLTPRGARAIGAVGRKGP